MYLWWTHASIGPYGETVGGLQACQGYQFQFGRFPATDDPQFGNFMLSKFALPLVVFSQHAMQCTYPSSVKSGPGERKRYILLHVIPVAVMSMAFACTWLVPSPYDHSYTPDPKAPKFTAYDGTQTLHWGGDFTHQEMTKNYIGFDIGATLTWLVIQYGACAHSGLVAYDFVILMPASESNVGLVHNLVLACVVGTLFLTEGTMQLGSKWCTYCLIYSVVYILDPLWYRECITKPTAPAGTSRSKAVSIEDSVRIQSETAADNGYRGTGSQLRYRGPSGAA